MTPNLYSKAFKALQILAEPTCSASSPANLFSKMPQAPHYPVWFCSNYSYWAVVCARDSAWWWTYKDECNWAPTIKGLTAAASLGITGTVPNTLRKPVISSSLPIKEGGIILKMKKKKLRFKEVKQLPGLTQLIHGARARITSADGSSPSLSFPSVACCRGRASPTVLGLASVLILLACQRGTGGLQGQLRLPKNLVRRASWLWPPGPPPTLSPLAPYPPHRAEVPCWVLQALGWGWVSRSNSLCMCSVLRACKMVTPHFVLTATPWGRQGKHHRLHFTGKETKA